MNYLTEIVAFTEWKEVYPLPASAIALWYELMAVCNKAGWRQEITVPNGLLQAKAGLSRREFENARQSLIQSGRVMYKKSNRVNQAGTYRIIPFVQKVQQNVQHSVQHTGHTSGNETCTYVKPKLKLKEKPLSPKKPADPRIKELIDFYHDKFKDKFGEKPVIDGGKDGQIFKALLKIHTEDKLRLLLQEFFSSKDQFIQKSGYTIGVFRTQVNRLAINNRGPTEKKDKFKLLY